MSTTRDTALPGFTDLPDLAGEEVGGATLATSDDFFAAQENLIKPAAAEWREGVYTDRGKWMDGWESRRRRDNGSHDWCIVRLGLPGIIKGVVVDTAFFRGNFPETCSIEATAIDEPLDLAALATATWTEVLPRAALQGDHKNAFAIASGARFTHVRLNIFPDGGVARLRVHGEAVPRWDRLRGLGGLVDLAALVNGAVVESCSDMFFGSRHNLVKPGPSRSMADGWETRRRRGPGNDWAIVRLATAGTIAELELDTSHFKGNAPGRVVVEGVHAPGVASEKLAGWRTLLATAVQPHTVHRFADELRRIGDLTHVRVSVFPCGGIARLRLWGMPTPVPEPAVTRLNLASREEATAAFARCCGATRWAARMADLRPLEDVPALLRLAERELWKLDEADWLEAFAAHPRIGAKAVPASGDAAWSTGEQRDAATAAAATLAELVSANQAYADRFGFIFIVCATGRSAETMLADLRARQGNDRAVELRTAAEEQAKITRLRLKKLVSEGGAP